VFPGSLNALLSNTWMHVAH